MAYVLGQKQTIVRVAGVNNLGTSDTNLGMIPGCFGAVFLLGRAYNCGNAEVVTFGTAQASPDGIGVAGSAVPFVSFGAGAANGTYGQYGYWAINSVISPGIGIIPYAHIRVFARIATTPTGCTFDVWPVFNIEHPNLVYGLHIPEL